MRVFEVCFAVLEACFELPPFSPLLRFYGFQVVSLSLSLLDGLDKILCGMTKAYRASCTPFRGLLRPSAEWNAVGNTSTFCYPPRAQLAFAFCGLSLNVQEPL